MNTEERLWADYRGTGMTVGKHPMAWRRIEMNALGVVPAMHLARIRDGALVRIAGSVVVRQRPGTAKGFVFLSMEDRDGMMNAIVNPATFDPLQIRSVGRAIFDHRWGTAESGWRDQCEGGKGRRTTRGGGAGVARFR